MDYIEKIVLNWILYSSDEVYTYKTKCKIVRYVKENPNDALLIASGLYFLDKDSKKIIVSARGHNFLEEMNRYKYAFGRSRTEYMYATELTRNKPSFFKSRDLMIEKFLSENVNRYKNTDGHISGSYLENLLLKMLASSNMYAKDSKEYEIISEVIRKRPDDVIEALFVCKLQDNNFDNLISEYVKRNNLDKEIDKLLVVARNLKLLYKDKYKVLKNDFILGLEDSINKTHADIEEDFYKFEEEKLIDEWLYLHTEERKYDDLLLAWWDSVSDFSKDREEYKKVVNYILNDSDTFLDMLMAMNILGVNIEDSINMALRGEDFEFDDLFKKYAYAGFNLKIYFKDAYNRDNFVKSLNNSLKRERRN